MDSARATASRTQRFRPGPFRACGRTVTKPRIGRLVKSIGRACGFARLQFEGEPLHASTRLSLSPERAEWKAQLAEAVGRHEAATGRGPIELVLRFAISPQRNWVTLWKPAIDALGGVLGEGERPWHPRDDRISLLVLQREIRSELVWGAEVDVWWAER
jgi:hypothetical protein